MTHAETTGSRGEQFIYRLFELYGGEPTFSSDKFDREKDMTVRFGELFFSVEVKTQAPLVKYNSFSFGANQLKKLQEVDFSMLIALKPNSGWDYLLSPCKSVGKVFKMTPNFQFIHWTDGFGNRKIRIPIEQKALSMVHTLSEKELDYLSEFTFKQD